MRKVNMTSVAGCVAIAAALSACGPQPQDNNPIASRDLPQSGALAFMLPNEPAPMHPLSSELCDDLGDQWRDAYVELENSEEAKNFRQSAPYRKLIAKIETMAAAGCGSTGGPDMMGPWCHMLNSELMAESRAASESAEYKAFEKSPPFQRLTDIVKQAQEQGCFPSTESNQGECRQAMERFESARAAQEASAEMQVLRKSDVVKKAMEAVAKLQEQGCAEPNTGGADCEALQSQAAQLAGAVDRSPEGQAVLKSDSYQSFVQSYEQVTRCLNPHSGSFFMPGMMAG